MVAIIPLNTARNSVEKTINIACNIPEREAGGNMLII